MRRAWPEVWDVREVRLILSAETGAVIDGQARAASLGVEDFLRREISRLWCEEELANAASAKS